MPQFERKVTGGREMTQSESLVVGSELGSELESEGEEIADWLNTPNVLP